jgi:hypothetical protein
VLIDGVVSAELVELITGFTNAKGKPLKAAVLAPDADLAAAESYRSALRAVSGRAALSECLLVVRDAARAQGALVENVLQFEDEAELPLLVAARVAAAGSANLQGALAYYLELRQAIELSAVVSATNERVNFQGVAWRAVTGDELFDLSGVLVPLTVVGFVTLRADGGVVTVTVSEPAQDELAEARNFVASLVHHGQVSAYMPGQRARGTHEIIADAHGQRRLVRVRSASR